MKVLNLFAGPGAGKSATASSLFAYLKSKHVNTELVGEFAKELIYLGNEVQLVNQVYIMASQYRKLKDLERNNVTLAISDSPLLLQMLYSKSKPYYTELNALVLKLNSEFENINVFINRNNSTYQQLGRVHTLQEAIAIDKEILETLAPFEYTISPTSKDLTFLEKEILKIIKS